MDTLNLIRIAVTLSGFVLFLLLVAHTYSRRRAPEHHDAALLPFEPEDASHG